LKIYIKTLGCPKNFNDSQAAAGILEAAGHFIAEDPEDADAVMVNTCGFINDAKKESIEAVFDMARITSGCSSSDNSGGEGCGRKLLIVSGCLSQRYGKELFAEMPEADVFLGVNDYSRLPQILAEYENSAGSSDGRKITRKKFLSEYSLGCDPDGYRKLGNDVYSSTIKIAEGCNNRCAYCVIPQIRGPYRSRPEDDIIREARELAAAGCRELIIIAQDTTAYGMDTGSGAEKHEAHKADDPAGTAENSPYRLAGLLRKLCRIGGIEWIRIMYAYEDRINDELIEVMASEPKICNYLDIPLQHCSDRILRAMDRRSTKASIEKTLTKLRTAMPDIHIRTTLITGFPGETEEDFEELLDFVAEQHFDRLGVFAYSAEENTPAAEMAAQVAEEVKEQRKDAVMRRQMEISLAANRRAIGQVCEVMVDGRDDDDSDDADSVPEHGNGEIWLYRGRTRYDAPEIDDEVIIQTDRRHNRGDIIKVRITDAFDYDLTGREVQQ